MYEFRIGKYYYEAKLSQNKKIYKWDKVPEEIKWLIFSYLRYKYLLRLYLDKEGWKIIYCLRNNLKFSCNISFSGWSWLSEKKDFKYKTVEDYKEIIKKDDSMAFVIYKK